MPTPQVTVVVVNFNTGARTAEAVGSLVRATTMPLDVVIVDNGSTDGSAIVLPKAAPQARLDLAGRNLGFGRAVNRGAASGAGDFVLLLNPDTTVLPGSIDALVAFAVDHPEFGLYGGRTTRPDGSLEPSSCWGAMTPWSLFCFASGLSTAMRGTRLFDPESLGSWRRDSVREVPVITGCLLLVRRDVWDLVGGMDERYFLYGEDAAFSARARRLGYRPVIVPDAVIVHEVGGSTSGDKMSMVLAGKTTLIRADWPAGSARFGLAMLQLGVGWRCLLEQVMRRSRPVWRRAWQRRAVWRAGYPVAMRELFGQDAAELAQERGGNA